MRKSLICRAFFVFMVNKSVVFAILLDHFLAKWEYRTDGQFEVL